MGGNATDLLLCIWDRPWGKSELRNLFHVNLKCADDSYVSLFATGDTYYLCAGVSARHSASRPAVV